MTRTLSRIPNLPVFLLAAAVVAIVAFGATRWVVDQTAAASSLPPLDVAADTAAAAPNALDPAKLYAQRRDTVVAIDATIGRDPMIGSGVVVDANDGTIITASHVIKNYETGIQARVIEVRFANGDAVDAQVVAIDQFNDLAVLHVDPSKVTKLVAAPLGASDSVLVGAEVAAIGSPYGKDWTQTPGNVSGVHRVVGSKINRDWDIPDAIQFDAAINPGNSGGPLFDARGQVIGIVQQIAGQTKANTGISFAVSSSIVQRALRMSKSVSQIPYAWTGITAVTLPPHVAKEHGLGATSGALVQEVTGPASRSGLSVGSKQVVLAGDQLVRLGDVVVELADRPITSADDLKRISGLIEPGQTVDVTIVRNGQRQTLQLNTATHTFGSTETAA